MWEVDAWSLGALALPLTNYKAIWLLIDSIYCNLVYGISGKAIKKHFAFIDDQKQQPGISIPWELGEDAT